MLTSIDQVIAAINNINLRVEGPVLLKAELSGDTVMEVLSMAAWSKSEFWQTIMTCIDNDNLVIFRYDFKKLWKVLPEECLCELCGRAIVEHCFCEYDSPWPG